MNRTTGPELARTLCRVRTSAGLSPEVSMAGMYAFPLVALVDLDRDLRILYSPRARRTRGYCSRTRTCRVVVGRQCCDGQRHLEHALRRDARVPSRRSDCLRRAARRTVISRCGRRVCICIVCRQSVHSESAGTDRCRRVSRTRSCNDALHRHGVGSCRGSHHV